MLAALLCAAGCSAPADRAPDTTARDIRAVLSGADTVFPKDALISMSPCIKGMIDRGELP